MISALSAAAVLTASLAAAPAAVPERQPTERSAGTTSAACPTHGAIQIAQPGERVLIYPSDARAPVQRLDELPRPDHEKSVLRSIDGCAAPVVVRHEVGR